jgi:hypothetical protein
MVIGLRAFLYLLPMAAGAFLSPAWGQQPIAGARDVMAQLAAAMQRNDVNTATSYLTQSSREQFAVLMDLNDRLQKAHQRFRDALKSAFPADSSADGVTLRPEIPPILRVDIIGEKEADPNLMAFYVQVHRQEISAWTPVMTWRALNQGGAWKFEMPGCGTAAEIAPTRKRIEALIAATEDVTNKVASRKFSSAQDARMALVKARRVALSRT